jgi:hypothetical protein
MLAGVADAPLPAHLRDTAAVNVGEGAVDCFLIAPVDRVARSLRRFTFSSNGGACTATRTGIHDASVYVGEEPAAVEMVREGWNGDSRGKRRRRTDPPWPTNCPCGYAFTPADERQVNLERIYCRVGDPSQTWPFRDVPPGAMWDAQWARTFGVGDDGRALTVRLPCGHDWHIDGPAGNGPPGQRAWTRQGEPPLISASPSILCKIEPIYHGWLGINGNPPGHLSAHIG